MSISLYHGDCLKILKQLPAQSIDCFICDLPYGCLSTKDGKSRQSEEWLEKNGINPCMYGCSWDVKINLEELWIEIKRLCKTDHTPVIMFCTTKFGYELIASNPSWFRYDLVWNKERGVSFLSANRMPMRSHEMIYVFSKKGAYYNRVDYDVKDKPERKDDVNKRRSDNMFSNGLYCSRGTANKQCVLTVIPLKKVGTFKHSHPTEKPIELYKWLIERYCPVNGTVLDPTAGSGNVGFACYDLDRECILIEKDDEFHKRILEKMELLEKGERP